MAASSQELNLASQLQSKVAQTVHQLWSDIYRLNQIYVKAGITFNVGDFSGTNLAYINPPDMVTLITQMLALKTWLDTSTNGDIFHKLSSGV